MRGLAALLAGAAGWMLIAGRVPQLGLGRRLAARRGSELVAASLLSGTVGGLLSLGVVGVPAAATAVGMLCATVPGYMSGARRRHERERIAEAWPDLLALMRARIAAGAAIPDAFIAAVRRTPALASQCDDLERETTFGRGFPGAVEDLRRRLGDPTADRVLVTLAAAHRTGGSKVGHIISALAASISDELRLRKAHHAALTEQRLTAAVALVAPWLLLALTIATNPQSASAFRTGRGTVVIAIGLAATAAGYGLAQRTARLSAAPRVFR